MKVKGKIGLGLGVAAIAALIYVVGTPRPIVVEIATVKRAPFREVIKSEGILRSKVRHIVPAFAEGDIKRVGLKTGDPVRKGQAITDLFWDIKYEPVKSPIDGVISKVFRESAGPIHRGEPIVEVVDPNQLEVVSELLTTDAARVRTGNPASVSGWGEEQALSASVARVSKAGFVKQSALGVEEEKTEVTMELKNIPENVLSRVGSTYHVDVSIEISKQENALVIPVGALFRDGALWAVYRISSGRAVRTNVDLLARGSGEVMLGGGINEGDQIVVFPGDLVKDGTRVRAAAK